jgi:diacylglycerol kinase family enzyme
VRERRISLGRANGRRFGFSAGIGVDSEAVRELETRRRSDGRRRGDLAYAGVIARRLASGYEPRLEIDGLGRAALLFVSNDAVFTYAGPRPFRFSPRARFELGLDVIAPERAGALTALRFAGRLFAGRGLVGLPGVLHAHDVDTIRVVCDEPLPLEADGEDLGDVTEAIFEAERDAVDVLVG